MCPNNPIGTVDVYFVTHHGTRLSPDPPALVHGLRPRVAVMQNGTRKGAGTAGDADDAVVAGSRRHLAAALVVQCGDRAEQRRCVHRQRGRCGDDRGCADGAAARRRAGWRPGAVRRRAAVRRQPMLDSAGRRSHLPVPPAVAQAPARTGSRARRHQAGGRRPRRGAAAAAHARVLDQNRRRSRTGRSRSRTVATDSARRMRSGGKLTVR